MEILGGPHYSVAGAGESHGPAVTTIAMGLPAGFLIQRSKIQSDLDRRRPGGNKHGTPRNEKDKVILLSGLYQNDSKSLLAGGKINVEIDGAAFATEGYETGYTTGEPIAAVVLSTSKKSGDYSQLTGGGGAVRPGHTDLVKHHQSRGFVDVRGGGRSSYRSTISDVIGGSIARQILKQCFGTDFLSSICQVGKLKADISISELIAQVDDANPGHRYDEDRIAGWRQQVVAAEIGTIDSEFATRAAAEIKATRKMGDSVGAAVEVVALNVPPLLGQPLYQSLKLRLMAALGGLNAVQSCEIGAGSDVIQRTGSVNNDPIRHDGYQSNSHGGLLGGITTGNPIVMRVGFKPTSTIHTTQQSVTKDLTEIDFELAGGRHDPCVGVRAGITLESRMAIELLNAVVAQYGLNLDREFPKLF